jgi:hypothetical protein
MRNAPLSRNTADDCVFRSLDAVKHAEEFFAKRTPAYAVDVKDGGMGGKARPDR